MSLPALQPTADTRSITERVNVLIRDYNNPPAAQRYVPPGVVLPFAGTTAPTGFLLCYGQAVSRTTYAALFAAIGTTFGPGDGSTTFNLPDLRGRAPFGKDDMGGSAANRLTVGGSGVNGAALGAAGGAETHTLGIAQMPAHSHGVNDPGHSHLQDAGANPPGGPYTPRSTYGDGTNLGQIPVYGSATGVSIQNTGGGGAHNNMPPAVVLNHIIAT
jgi:microcystin-dependent protein